MTLKSYYGPTIREALNAARLELGSEAVIVASRQADPSEGLPGAYEVVCGVMSAAATVSKAATVQTSRPAAPQVLSVPKAPEPPPAARNTGFADHLKKRVRTIRAVIGGAGEADTDALRSGLLTDGFGESLTADIIAGVRQRIREQQRKNNAGGITPDRALSLELEARLAVEPVLGRKNAKQRITALVGPPGAGKTSLIVKLAVAYGLRGRRPLRLISMDGARVGGADTLRTYAAGMAVPIDVLETGASLLQTLEGQPEAGLILIDTPGLSPADLPASAELAQTLCRHSDIDVQMVLPATMSAADMQAVSGRLRAFLPSRIAVTFTDSAASCRGIVGLALSSELPVSFLSTGAGIPEDLEEASAVSLLRTTPLRAGKSAVSAA